ncbi:MAG TPA: hypothetical protein VNQ76_12815 [Planctomicrobium sp.]|nr:hypothetical protein [Planctomicrobium sp.]
MILYFLQSIRRQQCWIALGIVLAGVSGCGKSDPFDRASLTGTVTFDGELVPYGEILFTPDTAKGNSGPSVVAPIRSDGTYQTQSTRGAIAGPAVAKIVAYESHPDTVSGGGSPKVIVDNYPVEVEIPQSSGTIDFHLTKDQIRSKKR